MLSSRHIAIRSAAAASLLVAAWAPARASDGRIPVYQPTTIAQPGSYYVTRDIVAPSGSIAILISDDNVTLDLAGHTLSTSGQVACVFGVGHVNVRIANGRIVGGVTGVYLDLGDYVVERLDVRGQSNPSGVAIGIEVGYSLTQPTRAIVRDCKVVGDENGGPSRGIVMNRVEGGTVESNTVLTATTDGIYLHDCGGVTLDRNHVCACGGNAVWLDTSIDCVLTRNTALGSGYGIYLTSSNANSLDGNVCARNNNAGVMLSGGSTRNLYSNNRLHYNAGGNSFGTGNVSAGGNNAGGANF